MASSSAVSGATFFTKTSSASNPSPKLHSSSPLFPQKTVFQGVSLEDSKKSVSEIFAVSDRKIGGLNVSRRFQVKARTAASKTIEVEVDKPLGLTLGQKQGGGVVITGVEGGGNAAKAGLKSGDQVLYTSSFFGDELWPADKLGFTKTAIQAKPDSVYFVVSRGAEVDVKKLNKRPAPPRFGRKLTETQKASIARATHICLDCGFIYTLPKPFDEQPDTYVCPQCIAPKKRFARYDVNTGKAIGGGLPPIDAYTTTQAPRASPSVHLPPPFSSNQITKQRPKLAHEEKNRNRNRNSPPSQIQSQTVSNGSRVGCPRLRGRRRSDHGHPPNHARTRRAPQRLDRRHAQPPETVSLDHPLLPLPPHGHLLEVRDPPLLRRRLVHSLRAPPPPEVDHEVPAQRAPDRVGACFLLDFVLRYESCCEDRAA
ncbi:unnamed protein product [Brassica oleracea]